ncbi:MAG: hypothetical protein CMJ78_10665 [Planctomycetaceae bacterium]|nr:hypothetical protein [Planctomycetaceae bacterium]
MIAAIRSDARAAREVRLRQTIAELEAVDDWHAIILAQAGIGAFDWPLNSDRFYMSPIFKSLLGYDEEDIPNTYTTWLNHVHSDDRDRIFHELTTPDERYETILRMRHRDGSTLWFLIRTSVRCNSNREPERLFGAAIDITNFQEELTEVMTEERQRTA